MTNQESAQAVKISGHNIGHNSASSTSNQKSASSFTRTDARYWRSRVYREGRKVAGVWIEDSHYSVRIAFDGRRERFNTDEREKAAAAGKAAEIYRSLDRFGWDGTLKEFKPQKLKRLEVKPAVPVNDSPSVGEYLAVVQEWAGLSLTTFAGYSRMLRLIVSEIARIPDGDTRKDAAGKVMRNEKTKEPLVWSRYDAKHGGLTHWRAKVDAVKLADMTPDAVQKWKLGFVKKAGAEPTAQTRAKLSFNSIIRQVRGLFSKKVLGLIGSRVVLPEPLPFAGVELFKKLRAYLRYQSNVDAMALLSTARDELAETEPEQFKVFVLALCCGLRRNEMDKLTWRQVDFDAAVIRIETTRFFKAKSDESNAAVDVEPEIVAVLRAWKSRAKSEFVIESDIAPRMGESYAHYRTGPVLDSLTAWLRGKGVNDRKPLHTLRKEFGSIVADKMGIYSASRALRHADVQVTTMHYLDKKQRIATGLGAVLAPANVETADFTKSAKDRAKSKTRAAGKTRKRAAR